ncbi:MAG: CHAT domain-containing protein [Acidobacteria bacterium]|nr:CHAT domain-containing protein [Acidobacteriota bacterium]
MKSWRTALAVLFLAASLQADEISPESFVREVLLRYAGGDVDGVRAAWESGEAEEAFLRPRRRGMLNRCRRLEHLDVAIVSLDAESAVVETRELFTTWGGEAKPRQESSGSRLTLRRKADEWRIVGWESREELLVQQLVDAPDAAERARLLVASGEDHHTTAFVNALTLRAITLLNQSRDALAIELIDLADREAALLGDSASHSLVLSSRSVLERYVGRHVAESIRLGQDAVALAEEVGDADVSGRALLRLARAYEDQNGAADPALLERIVTHADELQDLSIAGLAASQLARFVEARGEPRLALHYIQMVSAWAEETGDLSARISAALNLAGAFQRHGDYDLSLRYSRRAADLALDAGYVNAASQAINGIAWALHRQGHFEEALAIYEQLLPRLEASPELRSPMGEMLRGRAMLFLERMRLAEAERDFLQASSIDSMVDPLGRLSGELFMTRLRLARHDYAGALAVSERARSLSRGATISMADEALFLEALARRCLGQVEEPMRVLDGLVRESEAAEAEVFDTQRLLFIAGRTAFASTLLEMRVEQGQIGEALKVAETLKSFSLRDAVVAGKIPEPKMPPGEKERQDALDARVRDLTQAILLTESNDAERRAVLTRELTEARSDVREFRQFLYGSSPAMSAQHPPELAIDRLPEALAETTLLSYVLTDENAYAFVVGPGRPRPIAVKILPIRRAELTRKVERFVDAVEQRNLRADALAAELYDVLIAPVAPLLRETRSLCVLPDAELWRVPFHVLGPRRGRALIEAQPVFYAPSLAVLVAAEQRRAQRPAPNDKPTLLAFANPMISAGTASIVRSAFRGAVLGSIPETESEIRTIAALYGPRQSRIAIGREAREDVFKREAGHYQVLHVAAHGFVDDNSPMFSSLILAASPDRSADDGLLEAREIVGLQLEAELAVLSACDTGRAHVTSGEGVIGLSWALLAAGCPTTVVSQWKAQSAATEKLMVEFHRQLVAGVGAPEALRRAQLRLRQDARYRHPFYWAPFIVLGAP